MEIIDGQIHALHDIRSAFPEQAPATQEAIAVRAAIAAMDAVGVTGAIANWTPAFNEAAFRSHPDRFRTMLAVEPRGAKAVEIVKATMPEFPTDGIVPYDDAVHLAEMVAHMRSTSGMVALRVVPGRMPGELWRHNAELFARGGYDPAFALAAEVGMPICVSVAGALPHLERIAAEFSDTTVVIDHMGLLASDVTGPATESAVPQLLALATFPNIAVKVSGLIAKSDQAFPFADLWPLVRSVFDAFGTERVMWGSDFTVHQPRRTYAEALHFLLHTDVLVDSEKEPFFGGNLRRIFGWAGPEAGGSQVTSSS